MNSTQNKNIQDLLREVTDPEIPVLSIMDMGVVRDVEVNGKSVLIKITPTYSGCPAMDTIATDIKLKLDEAGYDTTVKLILSPAWTTDWITKKGRAELEKYGIAAPLDETSDKHALIDGKRIVKCTNCGSTNTKMVSQFGSTACKALFQCEDCLEPFDYFKCLK
ncbi:MAG: phenylacetate-CoA oxygenase subunit PaaJ [Saprospiraceae bacterium]|mgnify:CR=1 FL=1|nr:phenylacetate-CoA oxygenase subunit PaaJ [Saprospiraceae bacterium]MDG1434887.1 phenylacetate-CoA oxygenase subunit PaaJ [Saprospiraceae bacterium]MDG2419750.1 phenylacetate-CoA oxygenase subunit PaaJ [Saprospiraceae bacterium]